MLSHHHLIAFVATVDASRAKPFYETTLGLRLIAEEPFALVFDAHGTMLRIQKVERFSPPPFTALGWKTLDIAADLQRLRSAGVLAERYPHFEQDELGVWTAPSGVRIAWFKDPDGNTLSLTQF
jgi:catechol 2,3-dioxygenase-like lactoylglutathione lyase family enzyme